LKGSSSACPGVGLKEEELTSQEESLRRGEKDLQASRAEMSKREASLAEALKVEEHAGVGFQGGPGTAGEQAKELEQVKRSLMRG